MSVKDKARILFADYVEQREHRPRILTPDEEEMIVENARKNNQISELNRLTELFNIANILLIDIELAYWKFRSAQGRLHSTIMTIYLSELAKDKLYELLFDSTNNKQKIAELEAKHIKKLEGLFKISSFIERETGKFEPNILLQKTLLDTAEQAKEYNKKIYQLDYITFEAGFKLISDEDQKHLKDTEKDIREFVNLEGIFLFLQVCKEFKKQKIFTSTDRTDNLRKFFEILNDTNKATELTKKDKLKAKRQMDEIIEKRDLLNN